MSETLLTKKDFASDQTIRWCPGCGNYSILAQVQSVMPELGLPREKFVFVSGIGCSSRFPYYMNTFGIHSIHGRAPAIATGVKIANPDLSVWIITGDGDALSIGGNHFIHLMRRNVDLQLLLFNNRIYGLTKGQYSPTSEAGKKTKSSPSGSVDHPFAPCAVALGAEATFVARSVDIFVKDLREVIRAAHAHKGTSFVEIYDNCNIFNDGAFAGVTDRATRDERVLFLEHGKPLLFGGASGPRKGLRLSPRLQLEIVEIGDGVSEADVLVHDETNPVLANLLARLEPPFPVAMGVIYRVSRPTYSEGVHAQLAQAEPDRAALERVLRDGNTWTID